MKKILAVATALVLAISSLCVFVFADTTSTTYTYDSTGVVGFTLSNNWGSTVSGNTVTGGSYRWNEAYINFPSSVDLTTVTSISFTVSGVTGSAQIKLYYTDGTEGTPGGSFSADGTYSLTPSKEFSSITIQDTVGSNSTTVTLESVTLTMLVPVEETSGTRTAGVIYVNEDYHGVLITRTDVEMGSRTYLACVPHTVNSNGYCTVCKMYIGTDEAEAGTATIDGVEYDAAFSSDVNAAAGNWNKVSLGDSSFATVLSTEGALLVITRDSESTISYVSGEAYEKFMIGKDDSNHVDLATVGTTADDEEGLVAFTSDDGTTAIYDGATVYAALEAAGMADLDSYVLISNTSGSYTITNVSVYVPAGTIVSEDVGVDEPAEEGETETEEDGEDLTVEDETPAAEETNPTTGVALALVPMAIAGFAVVSSKRR